MTTREKKVQMSQPESELEGAAAAAAAAGDPLGSPDGLMRGTGATPRSGRVRVLARRMVPAGAGGLVVGMGTSEES